MMAERTITKLTPVGMSGGEQSPTLRIAAYCRVSTNSKEQEESFAAQVNYYTKSIGKTPNSILVGIYADEGISGRGTANREEFQRLVSDCKKGKIDRIITKSVSRFARNTVDCLQTVRMLSDLGISILFEKEQIDTAKMSSEVLLAMSGTQAQDESISHGNNMRWSYQQRMKKGEYLGNSPAFGYRMLNSSSVVIHEDEAEIVRMICQMFLSGIGKQKIADILNEKGIPYRRGQRWNTFIIRYILNNERYVGDALLQKKYTTTEYPPKRLRNQGEQAQYYVENALPAIISKEQRRAILELQQQRWPKSLKRGSHSLSKLLYCSECGHVYRRVDKQNGAVWQCSYRTNGRSNCTPYSIREEDVHLVLVNMVNKLRRHRVQLLLPLITRFETVQSKINGTDMKVYQVDQKIAALSKQNTVLAELLAQGILDTADFSGKTNELSERLSRLRAERREYLQQSQTDEQIKALRELYAVLDDMEEDLVNYKSDVICDIVDRITVLTDTQLQIHLKGGLTLSEALPKYNIKRCQNQ